MAVEPDSAGVRFPPPFIYLGALLLGLAVERFVTLRSFGIEWPLLVATGALLFVAGAAMMLAAGCLCCSLGRLEASSWIMSTIVRAHWARDQIS